METFRLLSKAIESGGIANPDFLRIPNGHLRVDPKTQHFICRPDDRPTLADINNAGRSGDL